MKATTAWATAGGVALAIGIGAAVFAAPATAEAKSTRASRRAHVAQLGARVESLGLLPGFADFLVASADIETGRTFNPNAGSSADSNEARGWFGMRPGSAFNAKNGLSALRHSAPNLLKDPPWAVALAADYARRVLPFRDAGQVVDFANLRYAWKFPHLIAATGDGAAKNRRQFERAATRQGIPLAMLDRPVVLGDWPGILPLVNALGGKLP